MQIIKIDQHTDEWLDERRGKITGSKLKDIVTLRGDGRKVGYYELMADRIAVKEGYEDPMERGSRLEGDALDLFESSTGKVVERDLFCVSDFNKDIALSPDGLIKVDGVYKEGVEVKCLSSARHLQAHFENDVVLKEYDAQIIQYFIVCEELETLNFVCYDPRIQALPLICITVTRDSLGNKVEKYKEYQERVLKEINQELEKLTF